jgi:ABC-type transporter Mla maintaining outer membrane lipid asymmetry permease subunit MlaE
LASASPRPASSASPARWSPPYVGYHAAPTIEGTSVATTRAVVHGSLLVLFLDFILTATLY